VRAGRHRPYLLALHGCLTARSLHSLFPDLQRFAQHSLQSSAKWANAPELVTVRERILAYRLPEVPPIPEWNPHDPSVAVGADVDANYRVIWRAVDEVIALKRTWDYHAGSNHRVRYYESYYPTWEAFLAQAEDAWTLSFLAWADECVEHGWGLYLDY
jgi:hypothetical protein